MALMAISFSLRSHRALDQADFVDRRRTERAAEQQQQKRAEQQSIGPKELALLRAGHHLHRRATAAGGHCLSQVSLFDELPKLPGSERWTAIDRSREREQRFDEQQQAADQKFA